MEKRRYFCSPRNARFLFLLRTTFARARLIREREIYANVGRQAGRQATRFSLKMLIFSGCTRIRIVFIGKKKCCFFFFLFICLFFPPFRDEWTAQRVGKGYLKFSFVCSQIDGTNGKHSRWYRQLHGGREVFLADREQPKFHNTYARGTVRDGMRLGPPVHLRRWQRRGTATRDIQWFNAQRRLSHTPRARSNSSIRERVAALLFGRCL